LLGALAVRGDAGARGAVETAAASEDPAVRLAALKALGTLGDETTVKTLMTRITAGTETAESEAARSSLVRLRAPRVNKVLVGMLAPGDSRVKVELIRILAARQAVDATVDLAKAAADPDATVRKESWQALGGLARAQDAAALLDLLVRAREDERDEAERAVAAVLKKPDRPGVGELLRMLEAVATPAAQGSLIRIAGNVGDDSALPALRKAVQSGDTGVRDAAIRALAAWPTPAPLEDLVNLARDAQESVHRVLALRGAECAVRNPLVRQGVRKGPRNDLPAKAS
jgi:HEAT repeat protein